MNAMNLGCKAVVACTFAFALQAVGQVAEKYVPPPMGTTWTAQIRNAGSYNPGPSESYGKLVEVMWQGQKYFGFESPTGTTVSLPSGDWITQVGRDGKPIMTWDPPIGYNWPLEVGKTWARNYKMTLHANNQTTAFETQAKVEAFEDVSVPAGTFKAFRIHITDNVGNDNLFWYAPDLGIFVKQKLTRTPASAMGAGTRDIEITKYTK